MVAKVNFIRARGVVSITPADSDLSRPVDAFRVGTTAGDVAIVDALGNTVTIPGVQVGEIVPVHCAQIRSTNTTATGITGFYE